MMKLLRMVALLTVAALLLCCVGCAKEADTAQSSLGGRPTASIRDVSVITLPEGDAPREVVIDVPAANYWTFNDLHDFLENPRRNDQQPFHPDEGEYLTLYEKDGQTVIENWNIRLQNDMVVVQYNAEGQALCRFTVNVKAKETDGNSTVISVPDESLSADNGSRPDGQTASKDNQKPDPSQTASQAQSKDPSDPASATASNNTSGGSSEPAAQKTVITVCGSKNNKTLKAAIVAFNGQSKTVEAVLYDKSTSGVYSANRLEQALEENNCPDLVLMSRNEMKTAADRGLLLELSASGLSQTKSLFHTAAWKNTLFDRRRYGAPVGCITACLACNDDILFRCDVGVPTDFASLIANARTVAKWSGENPPVEIITNAADSNGIAQQFIAMLWSFGGRFLSEDMTSAAFSSRAGLDVLDVYTYLQDNKLIGQSYSVTDFAHGNTAYGFVYSTEYSQVFGASARANFTAAPLILPGDKTVSPLDVVSYCIPATGMAGKPEAAYEFLQFYLQNPDYCLAECKAQDWIPAMTEAMEDEYYQSEEWQVFIAALETARPLPCLDFADTLYDYVAEAVLAVLSGEDPAAALTKAETKVNNRLAR